MKNMNKREIRKYCKTFKHKLPYVPKEKKRFTDSINTSIKAFLVEHPFATLEDIHREFGTVEELCEEYKDHLTPEQMTKSVRRTKLLCGLAGIHCNCTYFVLCIFCIRSTNFCSERNTYLYDYRIRNSGGIENEN